MKYLACCTMRSRSARALFLCFVSFLTTCSLQASVQQPETGNTSSELPFPELIDVLAANNLKSTGKPPFHLKLSFQVLDLFGKAEEQGTLDAWWAGPKGSHIELNAPSLGTLHDLQSGGLPNDQAKRSLYLLRLLTDAVWAPYGVAPTKGKLVSEKRTEKTTVMNCMHVQPDPLPAGPFIYRTACADDASQTIRIVTAQNEVVVRNRVGKFGPTRVALDVQVLLLGHPAITGHVDKLEGFDPERAGVVLDTPSTPSDSKSTPGTASAFIPSSVLAGKIIHKTNPIYPMAARQGRISGSVMLSATINQAGTIEDLFPIASADPLLTPAAMDAVKQWTYQPYLLNGKPTNVTTTITVNFALNSSMNR